MFIVPFKQNKLKTQNKTKKTKTKTKKKSKIETKNKQTNKQKTNKNKTKTKQNKTKQTNKQTKQNKTKKKKKENQKEKKKKTKKLSDAFNTFFCRYWINICIKNLIHWENILITSTSRLHRTCVQNLKSLIEIKVLDMILKTWLCYWNIKAFFYYFQLFIDNWYGTQATKNRKCYSHL